MLNLERMVGIGDELGNAARKAVSQYKWHMLHLYLKRSSLFWRVRKIAKSDY